ncbi:MAG TPA: CO dehydrogenase/acetyl-CoA synthase complex subunit epsilon [Methanosarcinales archaeon]|nr:CO dehydrogenase/acetyl-CoA synthase complex subunit epsilon [Methanosarcinales archaeon]
MSKKYIDKGTFSIEGLENIQINIGEIFEKDDWDEPVGPTPEPEIADLREWDYKLLDRYKPIYSPSCDMCCYCTYGKCDLTGNKEGACGIDLETHQARQSLFTCLTGASAHTAHARHLLNNFIERYGKDHPIDIGSSNVEAPLTRLIVGIRPKVIGDFIPVLDYIEEQITQMLATIHIGQEGSVNDFESKTLHAGMLDLIGMEVSDIVQMSCLGFPKSVENTPFAEIGMGVIDSNKPVILCIGHNVAAVTYIIDYMEEQELFDKIELAGICCTAHDMTRYDARAKIIGSMASQLRYIRSGIPDVIVVDEQCVRADVLKEAKKLRIPVIATNEKIMYGLPNRSLDDVNEILEDIVKGDDGAFILDYDKVGELVPKLAMKMHPIRRDMGYSAIPSKEEFKDLIESCVLCGNCQKACPTLLDVPRAMELAKDGDLTLFEELRGKCIGCGRCEFECPKDIPILNVIEKASMENIIKEKGLVRIGRGQMSDPEIREEGRNIVLGVTPGVIAIIGCPNYPEGSRDVYEVAEEMLQRGYIIVTSGCNALDLGLYKDKEGKTLYERYGSRFVKGNFINTGPCVSNAHIAGAAVKIANIFAKRNLRGNWEEIADYILNRVGAVGLAWGGYAQKAYSIGTGCNRLGVPVVVGPHGVKYRRSYIGRPYKKEEWEVYDARSGNLEPIECAPEHLFIAAETKAELMPLLAKLCIRPNDTHLGRSIKLTHYIELSEKYIGTLPDDWHTFIRTEGDLPLAKKETLLKILEHQHGWKIDWTKKKIIEGPIRKLDASWQPTNVERLCKVLER